MCVGDLDGLIVGKFVDIEPRSLRSAAIFSDISRSSPAGGSPSSRFDDGAIRRQQLADNVPQRGPGGIAKRLQFVQGVGGGGFIGPERRGFQKFDFPALVLAGVGTRGRSAFGVRRGIGPLLIAIHLLLDNARRQNELRKRDGAW